MSNMLKNMSVLFMAIYTISNLLFPEETFAADVNAGKKIERIQEIFSFAINDQISHLYRIEA